MTPSPTTGLVERLRSAGDIEQMLSEGHRSLHREAADAIAALSLLQPTVDREAMARIIDPKPWRWLGQNNEDAHFASRRTVSLCKADAALALLNPQTLKVGSEGGGV